MKEDIVNLGIVLLPPEEISQAAIQLSKDVAADFKTFFILGKESCLPHISLYHVAFPKRNLPQIKRELANLAEKSAALPLNLSSVAWQQEGWIDIQATKSKEFTHFHRTVLEALNPLREGILWNQTKQRFLLILQQNRRTLNSMVIAMP